MDEESTPLPGRPLVERSRWRRTASTVGGGVGCLVLLVALPLMAVLILGLFLGDPTFWIAVVALMVAVAALKAAKGSQGGR